MDRWGLDEAGAMKNLQERLYRAPMASVEMLHKVFGAFETDQEMAMIMYAIGPLYTEGQYDQNKGLASAAKTICRAKVHSECLSPAVGGRIKLRWVHRRSVQ